MTAHPEPIVREWRTWEFAYSRPRQLGWPVLVIRSVLSPEPMKMEARKVRVTVRQSPGGEPLLDRVVAEGRWLSGQQRAAEQALDLPGKPRRNSTVAPDWVVELAADALARVPEVLLSACPANVTETAPPEAGFTERATLRLQQAAHDLATALADGVPDQALRLVAEVSQRGAELQSEVGRRWPAGGTSPVVDCGFPECGWAGVPHSHGTDAAVPVKAP